MEFVYIAILGVVFGVFSFFLHRGTESFFWAIVPELIIITGGVGISAYAAITASPDAWIGLGITVIMLISMGTAAVGFLTLLALDLLFGSNV